MKPKQRILLIKPHQNTPTTYHSPPLGLLYLAAYLRRNGEAEVKILHMPVSGMSYDDLAEQITQFRPSWVGISALTFESDGIHRVAAVSKKVAPDVPVIVGGPHASSYTDMVMSDINIDYLVLGEGELSAEELSCAIHSNSSVSGIDGIVWRENGNVCKNPKKRFIEDLDALPFPAWDLIDINVYTRFDRMSRIGTKKYMGIFTSRACPFQCLYCHKMFGKGFRKRSPENVLSEIRTLHDTYDVRELEIIDDCFNLDLDRAKKIFTLITESGMDLRLMFSNGVRGDQLDEEFLIKGRKAGVRYMSFAVETASPRLQKLAKKNINLQKIRHNIALARKHHIIAVGYFMLGFPTETLQEIKATINFAVTSKLHAANFFAVTPFEGTELADLARSMNKPVFDRFDSDFMSGGFTNLTDIPDRVLKRTRQLALLRFWMKPSRIAALIRDYPDKRRLPHLGYALVKRILLKA